MKLLREVLSLPTASAFDWLEQHVKKLGYRLYSGGSKHCFYTGTIPVCLVAHIDTVPQGGGRWLVSDASPPNPIVYDPVNHYLWSPSGLGADDRAGVWGILKLLEKGYRPHILFTDEEECGGHGATEAAKFIKPVLDQLDMRCLIQLDRRGANDAVYYSCGNKDFHAWVEGHGFTHANGSFTDISILMPAWNIAGVNLSIGYYREHTKEEYLRVDQALATIGKVAQMLNHPPASRQEHREEVRSWAGTFPGETAAVQSALGLLPTTDEWFCESCYDFKPGQPSPSGLCERCLLQSGAQAAEEIKQGGHQGGRQRARWWDRLIGSSSNYHL